MNDLDARKFVEDFSWLVTHVGSIAESQDHSSAALMKAAEALNRAADALNNMAAALWERPA